LIKPPKQKSEVILDPPRCAICHTMVTLYPSGWSKCPHCGRPVCRQCWGPAAWVPKAFDAEKCVHKDGSESQQVSPIGERISTPKSTDWTSWGFKVVLGVLVVVVLYLLYDLVAL